MDCRPPLNLPHVLLLASCCIALCGCDSDRSASTPVVSPAGLSNDDCQQCHTAVWRQWRDSYHSKSYSDTNVQAAFRHFGFDRKCESCHAPEPVFLTGLESEVALRTEDRQSGVNCISCHATADGSRVAASRTIDSAPCKPLKVAALTSGEMCGVCHTAIYEDWEGSRYEIAGKTCQSCHMPADEDRPGGFDHLCIGAHDDRYLRNGVKMSSRIIDHEITVDVTNHATGHNFPGERHNRVLHLEIIQKNHSGDVLASRQFEIKGITPFRGETSAEQIRIDQTVHESMPLEEETAEADVRLLFKHFPWHSEREAVIVKNERLMVQPLEPK